MAVGWCSRAARQRACACSGVRTASVAVRKATSGRPPAKAKTRATAGTTPDAIAWNASAGTCSSACPGESPVARFPVSACAFGCSVPRRVPRYLWYHEVSLLADAILPAALPNPYRNLGIAEPHPPTVRGNGGASLARPSPLGGCTMPDPEERDPEEIEVVAH